MNKMHDLAMPLQDLATLLTSLAGQLRRDALAVTGLAHQEGDVEDDETRALAELAVGLERAALLLDVIRPRLCRTCQMIQIEERWVFSAPGPGGRRAAAEGRKSPVRRTGP